MRSVSPKLFCLKKFYRTAIFHFNSYRNFKHYYLSCVQTLWKDLFPQAFSYNRFIEVMSRCFVAMTMFLKLALFGKCTGISFVDSTAYLSYTKNVFSA